jgi:hypothetical protein
VHGDYMWRSKEGEESCVGDGMYARMSDFLQVGTSQRIRRPALHRSGLIKAADEINSWY